MITMHNLLMEIYKRLYQAYGPRHWWPGESALEIMVGAILTQNTSWRNVEKAIQSLKDKGVLTIEGIHRLKTSELGALIRSSGTYRVKADRLKAFIGFLIGQYEGDLQKMKKEPLDRLRRRLLEVKGVGPETADSILLYALGKPVFVVDAYTKRILLRHGIASPRSSYEEIRRLFMDHLPFNEQLFNEYHALLVYLGKKVCKKVPQCDLCPINNIRHRAWRIAHRKKKEET